MAVAGSRWNHPSETGAPVRMRLGTGMELFFLQKPDHHGSPLGDRRKMC
jgi:hypothetical protein